MSEPIYDEDTVNLGYLKKAISDTEKNIDDTYKNVSRHYASKPVPPYYKGDTWIDGDIVYVCINTRTIGLYQDADWVTESGAKEEAEKKNKTYLTQPSNYSAGDMWILQSDDDHKAGKRGEILISNAGRSDYDEDDWVNMLGYGTIISINEVANNLNDAINRIGSVEDAIEDGLIVTFYQDTIPEGKHIGDLWYVTGELEGYIQGKIYRYDGINWVLLDDPTIQEAFNKANEARIVADGKIQSFYSATEPTENMGVGDLWIDLANNNQLYRYNGTNWVAVYDTRINELVTSVDTVTERVATIETDLGEIDLKVQETTTTIENVQGKMEDIEQSAVSSVQVMYALGTSKTEVPTEGWSVTAPEWTEGMYMWQKTITTYGDGTVIESDATNISGAKGQDGANGQDGSNGNNGESAYQIAVDSGFEGTEEEWIASLKGEKGETGDKGETGQDGKGIKTTTKYYLASSDGISGNNINIQWNGDIAGRFPMEMFPGYGYYKVSDEIPEFGATVGGTVKVTTASTIEEFAIVANEYVDGNNNGYICRDTEGTGLVMVLLKPNESMPNYPQETGIYFFGQTLDGIPYSYVSSLSISTDVSINTEGWTTEIQMTDEINKYLWSYEVVEYTDGTTNIIEPIIIGTHGETGIGVSAIVSEYYLSTSNTAQEEGTWSETQPEWEDGKYFWTRSKITWTDSTVTYTDPILAEGINNANQSATTAQQLIAEQKILTDSINNTVSETVTRLNNDYMTTEQVEAELGTTKEDIEILKQKQASTELTSEEFKVQIDSIINDGVSKVKTSMGYSFDDKGFELDREGAETGTIIDEAAIKVIDKTGAEEADLLYAGYVKEGNTNYPKYVGQSIVVSANMIVQNYLVVPNSRFEAYENPVLGGKGTGVFEV